MQLIVWLKRSTTISDAAGRGNLSALERPRGLREISPSEPFSVYLLRVPGMAQSVERAKKVKRVICTGGTDCARSGDRAYKSCRPPALSRHGVMTPCMNPRTGAPFVPQRDRASAAPEGWTALLRSQGRGPENQFWGSAALAGELHRGCRRSGRI